MKGFQFQSTKSALIEPGSSRRLGELARGLGVRSLLIVTDKGIEQAGLLRGTLEGLEDEGIPVTLFTEVEADPPEDVIHAAVDIATTYQIDGVIGFGGGSSMDVAKLVALLATGSERLQDVYGVGNARGPRLPLILVPTTAGTGSEVTPISIVTTGDKEKKGVASPVLLPDWAVLDADLTLGLPAHVTAATGIDSMVHAIEAMTSKRLKNPISDCLAREALHRLGRNIREVCEDGRQQEARQEMLLGAMLAGMAFANAPVGGVHALAYPIGARFHVPHGLSNSLVLPRVLEYNSSAAQSVYAEIADILVPGTSGDDQARVRALIEYLRELPETLGLPTRLSEVGISQGDVPQLASDAMLQTRLLINNPRDISEDDALTIYREVL